MAKLKSTISMLRLELELSAQQVDALRAEMSSNKHELQAAQVWVVHGPGAGRGLGVWGWRWVGGYAGACT